MLIDSLNHLQWDLAGEEWGESTAKNLFEIVNLRFTILTIYDFTIVTTLTSLVILVLYKVIRVLCPSTLLSTSIRLGARV
jgi:hypothetical protein